MSNSELVIIKSSGEKEAYNPNKIAASIYKSCLAVNSSMGEAEKYGELIAKEIDKWLKTKTEVTTTDLRIKSSRELKKYHPEAAYFYENYKNTI
ncbi:MAG: ATP cone domain-containing protein [Candidatus Nanosyncoccaceae bacterium]|jgi:transcriptional regulator NrdR family protein